MRTGDHVKCAIAALVPLKADPENIPLNIVFEDDYVIVVNKPADMVSGHIQCKNVNSTLLTKRKRWGLGMNKKPPDLLYLLLPNFRLRTLRQGIGTAHLLMLFCIIVIFQ